MAMLFVPKPWPSFLLCGMPFSIAIFAAFTPTVAGSASVGLTTVSGENVGNTVTFTVTFPETGALAVEGIIVKDPPATLSYTSGENLDLTGLVVTLTYNDSSTEDVPFENFPAKGITASPAHGTKLTTNHDNTPITLTCSGFNAYTGNLTVSPGGSTPTPPAPTPVPAPTITVTEVQSELFASNEEIEVEADVKNAFGESVEVKITDDEESQNEVFQLVGSDDDVYPFDISLYSRASGEKVQPREGHSVRITLPVPEKLLDVREKIKVVYVKDGKLEVLMSLLIEKDGKWYVNFEAADTTVLTAFNDAKEISGYAKEALAWAYNEGIIAGKGNGILDPRGFATRAETAMILLNYQKVK